MSNDGEELNILWVAPSQMIHGYGFKPHKHHSIYQIAYVHYGECTYIINKKETRVTPGQIVFINKGVTHGIKKIQCPLLKMYEIKFVVFDVGLTAILPRVQPIFESDAFTSSLIKQIIFESTENRLLAEKNIHSYLLSFLYYITQNYREAEDSASQLINTTGYTDLSKAIIQYMEKEYMNDINLQSIAHHVDFNKNYICSVFKNDSGMTIGSCLNLIRIRKAAELITYSDMNLAQVADSTGFANLSHFNRIFKKIAGIPPGQYRQSYTAEIALQGDLEIPEGFKIQEGFLISALSGKKIEIETVLNFLDKE